jgi:hypothetical protein
LTFSPLFVASKKQVLDVYKAYEAWLKTQANRLIKKFHSDRGGEFMSKRV